MSFSYHPFNHIEVIHKPHGNYKILCDSCGAQLGDYTGEVPIGNLFIIMNEHVRSSHNLTPEDVKDWSIE